MGLTDRVRKNITQDPLRKVKEQQELTPPWMVVLGPWIALVIVVLLVLFAVLFPRGGGSDEQTTTAGTETTPAQEVNPHENTSDETEDPGVDQPGASTEEPSDEPQEVPEVDPADFESQEPATFEVANSSLPSKAPAGAASLAVAAAYASTTGDWSELPVTSEVPTEAEFSGAQVDEASIMLTDPVTEIAENTAYGFAFDATGSDGAPTRIVVRVQAAGDSFEVITE